MSNAVPISATYTDVPLQGGERIQLEPLTIATIWSDSVLSIAYHALVWLRDVSNPWETTSWVFQCVSVYVFLCTCVHCEKTDKVSLLNGHHVVLSALLRRVKL